MNLIIDTNVFLPLAAAKEEPLRMYSKYQRVWQSYLWWCVDNGVLIKEGFNERVVHITLAQFYVRNKLRHITARKIRRIENEIITHEKDI